MVALAATITIGIMVTVMASDLILIGILDFLGAGAIIIGLGVVFTDTIIHIFTTIHTIIILTTTTMVTMGIVVV